MNRPLRLQTTVAKRAALAWLVAATLAMVPRWAAAQGARPGKPSPPSAKNAPAATPSTPLTLWRAGTQTVRSQVADIEAVQMLTAVIGGSQMGPGEGWFHPGKSRYGWQWLAARYDRDGNGVISAEEFSGPAESFRQLDRDHNGELAALDFDWSDMSPFVRQQGQAGQWFGRIDKSSNGRISAEEWQLFFQTLAGEKGYLSREDLRSGFFPPAPKSSGPPQPGQEGPSTATLLQGIFSGELGSLRAGPAIDDPAPDFELETQDHSQKIRLSRFRNDRPVVLIFGSFT